MRLQDRGRERIDPRLCLRTRCDSRDAGIANALTLDEAMCVASNVAKLVGGMTDSTTLLNV